jgi:hypothetical protein
MESTRKVALEDAQHKNEFLAVSEFDFLFPRFDILPRVGATILQLQGFGLVHIVDRAWVGNLAILVAHSGFYSKIQVLAED